jgi:hypothetical protein
VFHYFIDLLFRTTHYFLTTLGTSLLGFFIPAILSVAGITMTLVRVFRRQGWAAVIAHWQRSLRKTFVVALAVGFAVYTPIFVWSLVSTIYNDHLENQNLRTENQRLRIQLGSPNSRNGNTSNPLPQSVVVSQSAISELRRLNAEGNIISLEYATKPNKRAVQSKYAAWMTKTIDVLDTKINPSYGQRFKNATPYLGSCPTLGAVDDCTAWQDMVGKSYELEQILSELHTE